MTRLLIVLLLLAAGAAPVAAQTVEGSLFEDRDGDGLRDPGEPAIASQPVRLFGTAGVSSYDQTVSTAGDGSFVFSPGDGCYVLSPGPPSGWRLSSTRTDGIAPSTPGYTFPVGQPRLGALQQVAANLQGGTFRYSTMGDSIAANFSVCEFGSSYWYSNQLLSRLQCAGGLAGGAASIDEAAVKGEHTDDLLTFDTADLNNIFRYVGPGGVKPQLFSLSMIGNDMLDVDPGAGATPAATNRAVAEILDARANLQEALSTLLTEVPGADIILNSLYDNEAYNCSSGNASAFHNTWLPVVNQLLRDLAWGQVRQISINEIAAEIAHEDMNNVCTGFEGMICRDLFGLDNIHPSADGYSILREKIWESAGGASLGSSDALGRTSIGGIDYGLVRHVARVSPTSFQALNGAVAVDPAAAMDGQDGGTPAKISLGAGNAEFRLGGFPDYLDEVQIVRAVAGVRYRTVGSVVNDPYRIEASVTGQFRPPPGHNYIPTDWNFYTPIVGGGGPNMPPENPDYPQAVVLVVPDIPGYREVSATLSKNPELPGGAGEYIWPAIDHDDLSTATIRVAAAALASGPVTDVYEVELDHAWLDLYGWEKPRPAEATGLDITILSGGSLEVTFDEVAGATRYNLYFGRPVSLRVSGYDHGAGAPAGPLCDAITQSVGGGRLSITIAPQDQPVDTTYVLVTGHVDDVESPAGVSSSAVEIDRSQSVCR